MRGMNPFYSGIGRASPTNSGSAPSRARREKIRGRFVVIRESKGRERERERERKREEERQRCRYLERSLGYLARDVPL